MTGVDWTSIVSAVHLASALYMVGLIWFVQRVHYPLLSAVGREEFGDYERAHIARTGPVVGPPMALELLSAVALVVLRPAGVAPGLLWLGLGLLAVIWLSTAFLQVPRHGQLSEGFDADVCRSLVRTNWIRTVAWSLRGLLALWVSQAATLPLS